MVATSIASAVLDKVRASEDTLFAEGPRSDALGKLTDTAARLLRESGLIRMLQPAEYDGYEAHPSEFLEAAMGLAAICPPAGWVGGVVGVHPWEVAMMDPRLQEEIWGGGELSPRGADTWTASPYMPGGTGRKVDGGYLFSGRWSYSSGTDHCDWIILGGFVDHGEERPGPPEIRHFVLPRSDYEIVPDSWNVMGLLGTGSKDIVIEDKFVPEYRTVDAALMNQGGYEDRQQGKTLYRLKFPLMFSAAISAATQGIAQGALARFEEYLDTRVSGTGDVAKTDPNQLLVYGEAAAHISASRSHLLHSTAEIYDFLAKGGELTRLQRLAYRRDQVTASRRAVDAVDVLFKQVGGAGIHTEWPLERFWRDVNTAQVHICNVQQNIQVAWASERLTGTSNPTLFA